MIFRVVVGLASAVNVMNALTNFGRVMPFGGLLLFYVNLIELPVLIAFIFVFLINWLFMKRPVSFFKTELYYLLIQVCAWILFSLSYINCPTCPG